MNEKFELMTPEDRTRMTCLAIDFLIMLYTIRFPNWRRYVARLQGYHGAPFWEKPRMSYEWAPPADPIARLLSDFPEEIRNYKHPSDLMEQNKEPFA